MDQGCYTKNERNIIEPSFFSDSFSIPLVQKNRFNQDAKQKRDFIIDQQIARHFVQYSELFQTPFQSMQLKILTSFLNSRILVNLKTTTTKIFNYLPLIRFILPNFPMLQIFPITFRNSVSL